MNTKEFDEIIITLYEKHYDLGVGALINSLCNSHFAGLVYVGYRGNLSEWTLKLKLHEDGYYQIGALSLKFIKIEDKTHFGYFKPYFFKETINSFPSVKKIYYFDPDIVINANWSFFSKWAENGVCLCLDNCFHYVPPTHPWRKEWMELFSNITFPNKIDYYCNSGFIGIDLKNYALIDRWIEATERFKEKGGDVTTFLKEGSRAIKTDQDLMNAAITVSSDLTFSVIGKEGMGFSQPAYLMTHAVSNIKPWKKNFVFDLLKSGNRPSFAEKNFFNFCDKPISIFSGFELSRKKLDLKIASLMGRLIG